MKHPWISNTPIMRLTFSFGSYTVEYRQIITPHLCLRQTCYKTEKHCCHHWLNQTLYTRDAQPGPAGQRWLVMTFDLAHLWRNIPWNSTQPSINQLLTLHSKKFGHLWFIKLHSTQVTNVLGPLALCSVTVMKHERQIFLIYI